MKKIPTSFIIKGTKYSIKHKWNLTDDNGHPCYGLTDFDKKIIWIDRLIKDDVKMSTFYHETLHCLLKEIKASGTILSEDNEEFIIQNIEHFTFEKWNMRLKK
jgi:hypothetical protein